jgi:hypothetical protein
MKKFHAILLIASALACASNALASVSQTGLVRGITANSGGVVYFYQSGARDALPGCATGQPGRWSLNGATPSGQALLAILLSANATGKKVVVAGKGNCDVAGDTESVSFLYIDD